MNILFCSAGRFAKMVQNMKESLGNDSKIVAVANQNMVPAIYYADEQYVVSNVTDSEYIDELLYICEKEDIDAVFTILDIETIILSKNKHKFEEKGIKVFVPSFETAKLCFDKYSMHSYLKHSNIKTINTYNSLIDFEKDYLNKKINFPVFVKPNNGNGSVGARKVYTLEELNLIFTNEKKMIIQEYIDGEEIDVDVYIDYACNNVVSVFSKRKIEASIGGTQKAISFIDKKLNLYIKKIVEKFEFKGAINIELFYTGQEYILIEINPRLSAANIHAYDCGVDFFKLMENNINGIENKVIVNKYKEGNIMMLYDNLLTIDKNKLIDHYNYLK